jgi:hypothetical protein
MGATLQAKSPGAFAHVADAGARAPMARRIHSRLPGAFAVGAEARAITEPVSKFARKGQHIPWIAEADCRVVISIDE